MKYTHKVTLLHEGVAGTNFLCGIKGFEVYVSAFTKPDGAEYGDANIYEASTGAENLTPELWFDDVTRWKVEKLKQFKGNK